MKRKYPTVEATAHVQTDKAVCLSFEHEGVHHESLWVPLSVIHDTDHDTIEEAVEGDTIEVSIADWWLSKQ